MPGRHQSAWKSPIYPLLAVNASRVSVRLSRKTSDVFQDRLGFDEREAASFIEKFTKRALKIDHYADVYRDDPPIKDVYGKCESVAVLPGPRFESIGCYIQVYLRQPPSVPAPVTIVHSCHPVEHPLQTNSELIHNDRSA